MPFTKKQERYLHANNIKHSHDYLNKSARRNVNALVQLRQKLAEKGITKYQIDKHLNKPKTFIITRLDKKKEKIRISGRTYILS